MKWQGLGFGLAVLFLIVQAGCNNASQESGGDQPDGGEVHEHAHDEKGPHGGQIVDLGKGEYHAELLHDDETHQVTIHLLDSKLKDAVLAAEDAVRINVSIEGATGSYSLKPVDPADGKASQFQLVSEALAKALDAEGENITRRLSVTIDGKPYNEAIEAHEHDHGHGHDGHDDDHDH